MLQRLMLDDDDGDEQSTRVTARQRTLFNAPESKQRREKEE